MSVWDFDPEFVGEALLSARATLEAIKAACEPVPASFAEARGAIREVYRLASAALSKEAAR